MLSKFFTSVLFSFLSFHFVGQNYTQTVRGIVTDKVSNEPLIGAVIVIQSVSPVIGTASDYEGRFKLENVPVGRQAMQINMLGYKTVTMQNVLVNSGKELVLNVAMEEEWKSLNEVKISAEKEKGQPLNAMAGVSGRTFSVEETQKFAAAVNDPGRMAISFAGVVSGDDGGNQISIRGNSPYGLLWKMEGIDIPNPNHFSNAASSGGGISILSAQLLSNSDFFTGAFSAEYGNALSGVFDLRLRKGNNEKHEYTIQAGLLGLDVAAEGPFKKGYGGSYLVNCRYSTLSLLGKIGVPLGDAITNFQDLSFNFFLPSEKFGNFQLFGFGGLSSQTEDAKRDTSQWDYRWQQYDSKFHSNTGAVGVKHVINLAENTYLQSTLMVSGNDYGYAQSKLNNDFVGKLDYEETHMNNKLMVTTVLNHKFNARHNIRTGVYFSQYGFNLLQRMLNNELNAFETQLNANGSLNLIQGFGQWKYRMNERLTLNTGIHAMILPLNNSVSIEPRMSARYQLDEFQSLSAGYGLHSQIQPVGVYQAQVLQSDGSYLKPNKNLGFNKAQHFVVGYQRSLTKYMYVKTEVYYQYLFNVAIGADSGSTMSSLNNIENYITDALNNNGKGKNYGIELTLEQYMRNNLYFLLSGSLYDSKYLAADHVWRNTRFNSNYALTFTAGKEWKLGSSEKNRMLGANIRAIYRGGLRETPIDFAASMACGETQYIDSKSYSLQVQDYFRTDLRISLRRNRAHSTTTIALDIQNATNRKNIYGKYFEPESGTLKTSFQTPLIPILSYKLEF